MRRASATVALWLASGSALVAVAGLFGSIVWRVFLGGTEVLPEILPLKITTLEFPSPATELVKRNPFDPSGMHWQDAPTSLSPTGEAGALSGVVLLPGLRLAITETGIVKPGEALAGGTFRGFRGDQVTIETATGRLEKVDVPGANRPRLNEINQAGKDRPRAASERKP